MFKRNKHIPPTDFFPREFVDIHSHLVPGIDDGAKDLENSLELIGKMAEHGVRNIITTPHILGSVYPNDAGIIKSKGQSLKDKVKEVYPEVDLRFAAEYMMDGHFLELLENEPLMTLKDRYVLVEMSYLNPPANLYDILYEVQMKDYEPVLAHPERYGFYHQDFNKYKKLKDRGIHFQMNLLSLTRQYGKSVQKTATKLLNEGMIDFVGTDTHHVGHLRLWREVSTERNRRLLEPVMARNVEVFSV